RNATHCEKATPRPHPGGAADSEARGERCAMDSWLLGLEQRKERLRLGQRTLADATSRPKMDPRVLDPSRRWMAACRGLLGSGGGGTSNLCTRAARIAGRWPVVPGSGR